MHLHRGDCVVLPVKFDTFEVTPRRVLYVNRLLMPNKAGFPQISYKYKKHFLSV